MQSQEFSGTDAFVKRFQNHIDAHPVAAPETAPASGGGQSARQEPPQVPVVGAMLAPTTDSAGVSPHAPQADKILRKTKRRNVFEERVSTRVKATLKIAVVHRAEQMGYEESDFVREILEVAVGLPPTENSYGRNIELKEAYNQNTVALNRIGNLLNQLTAATHKQIPCPLSREEVTAMMGAFNAACRAHLSAGMANDH